MSATTPRRSYRPRSTAQRIWWSLCATLMLVAVGGFAIGDAGAVRSQEEKGGPSVVVDRIDATGDDVRVEGSLVGADVETLTLASGSEKIEVTDADDGIRNEVVVVIDNASALGNATVQLAKDGLAPLMPGDGPVATMGIVSTGGGASVQTGPTASQSTIDAGLASISPQGTSATWDGLVRAAELLDDRDPGVVGTVVLFSASPSNAVGSAASAAESALQRAGVRLDVVALPMGSDLGTLRAMVDDLGGSMEILQNDEQLAGAYEDVAAQLAGRFSLGFAPVEGADGLIPLTVSSGEASSVVSYTPDALRTGVIGLAPAAADGAAGASFLTGSVAKILILVLGLAAIAMLAWVVMSVIVPDDNNLTRRLEVYDESYGVEEPEEFTGLAESHTTVPIIQRAVEFTGDMAEKRGVLETVESKLEQANLPLRAPEAMFFTAVGAIILTALFFVLTGNILVAIVVLIVAAILPTAILNFLIRRRQKAFRAQLPDMLTLLAGTLRAGYSIGQGFESCSTEVSDPMGRELRRVVSETRLGRSLEESLESVAERMQSDDFSWAVMAIRIQREVGGNLAELLLTVADTMTQRERLRREVSTLTAEGRISAFIIGGLPPALAAVMFVMNPSYIKLLFTPGIGYALVIAALVMMGIGFAWMKKCITIEV